MFHLFGCFNTSFALSLPAWISDASIFSNSSMSATEMSPVLILPAYKTVEEFSRWDFLTELVESWQVFGRYWVIFHHRTKWNYWSCKWFAEPPFVRCFPIRHEVLNVSQMAATPFFIQAWLQQYFRVPSSILRTALSAIPFVSERWGVDVQWCQDRSSQALPNSGELSV